MTYKVPKKLGSGNIPPLQIDLSPTSAAREAGRAWQHLYVLPVLLLEFSALALTRAVLPSLLLQQFGNRVYIVMGCVDCVRGSLAFLASPLFGKISDATGRRICLLVTVLGTCAPVCSLAFFSWHRVIQPDEFSYPSSSLTMNSGDINYTIHSSSEMNFAENLETNVSAAANEASSEGGGQSDQSSVWQLTLGNPQEPYVEETVHPMAIIVFTVLLALSGIFSSTFTLVFAYISDTVRQQEERVSAYGLALATFGLSFTIGPMTGGYLAQYNKQYVFMTSLFLTVLDLLYIYLILPESRDLDHLNSPANGGGKSSVSLMTMDFHFSWNPLDTLRVIIVDPFLRKVAQVAFLYYTGLWAIISTLSVYAVKRFHLGPERLGELMSALGLCTMVAEAVLVRIVVPMVGEKKAMKIGLISFALQCIVLGFAFEPWHLFVCAFFSLAGNLVYPSLSSLVSGSVEPDSVGESLGAINGVKALTEGIGPLVFGSLMTLSEHSGLPGWPYLLAAVLSVLAYKATEALPDPEDDEFIHELNRKKRRRQGERSGGLAMKVFGLAPQGSGSNESDDDDMNEYDDLLSENNTSLDEGDVDK